MGVARTDKYGKWVRDQISISKETARILKLGDRIYNSEFMNESATQVQRQLLDNVILEADGFAEVFPEHKFAIVQILQEKGEKVGMTGREVSDAKADVGKAVSGAADAAKAAADLVLTAPDCQ